MHEDTFIAQLHTCGRTCTYSVQCSDKKKKLSATAHQMQRTQVLPGYPHSSAGTYAVEQRCMKKHFYMLP